MSERSNLNKISPASMLQVALVQPYGEVDNTVKQYPSQMVKQGNIPQRSYKGHKRAWEKNMGHPDKSKNPKDQLKTGPTGVKVKWTFFHSE